MYFKTSVLVLFVLKGSVLGNLKIFWNLGILYA